MYVYAIFFIIHGVWNGLIPYWCFINKNINQIRSSFELMGRRAEQTSSAHQGMLLHALKSSGQTSTILYFYLSLVTESRNISSKDDNYFLLKCHSETRRHFASFYRMQNMHIRSDISVAEENGLTQLLMTSLPFIHTPHGRGEVQG